MEGSVAAPVLQLLPVHTVHRIRRDYQHGVTGASAPVPVSTAEYTADVATSSECTQTCGATFTAESTGASAPVPSRCKRGGLQNWSDIGGRRMQSDGKAGAVWAV